MKKILLVAGCFALLSSCNKKNDKEAAVKPDFDSTAVESQNESLQPLATNCFIAVSSKDSLFLSYEDNLGTVTGKLSYKNHEKDSSKGDLSGLINGDTLKVTYTFESEGSTSSREIWFLKKGSELLEGIGKYDASGEYYADPKSVKFDDKNTLKSADCKTVEKKF